MPVINNPDLRAIAMRIVSAPGFGSGQQAMRRALGQWFESVSPRQREAAEQALIIRWLEDVHAEFLREQRQERMAIAAPAGSVPGTVIAGHLEDEPAPRETPLPVSDLKFRSESPEWQEPAVPLAPVAPVASERPPPPWNPPIPPKREAPRNGPVKITRAEDRAPVPQPSRKVEGYRQMFPELAFPVQTESGAKPLAEFTVEDIEYRRKVLAELRQGWRMANSGDESRIRERERLNAKDRVQVARRAKNIRDAAAEDERLSNAEREIAAWDCALVGELPEDVLAACGFKRRSA